MTTFHHLFRDQILDAAVSSGADSILDLKFKVVVLPDRNDIAGVRTRFTLVRHTLDGALLDHPATFRHSFSAKSTPAVPSLAIEEQLPSSSFFRRRERVRKRGCNGLASRRRLFLRGRFSRETEHQAYQHQTCSHTKHTLSHFRCKRFNYSKAHNASLLIIVTECS